jgi:hypothetical protein
MGQIPEGARNRLLQIEVFKRMKMESYWRLSSSLPAFYDYLPLLTCNHSLSLIY